MSSNDNEHAQSGDMIEITTHLRNDLGKRMQVSTSDGLSVVALDNRMRVTVAHGDYKVVRRCGRPATDDAPKKRGRPSNAELAARAAAVSDADWLARADAARAEGFATPEQTNALINTAKPVVTDADVAGLEAAIAKVHVVASGFGPNAAAEMAKELADEGFIDVPVTRKAALTVDESKVTVESGDVSVEAAVELMTQEQIDAATENLRPLYGITQEEFDAMTTHTEPRGFVTGIKHDGGKVRMDLLDPIAIEQLAAVLTFGAQKYEAHNWRKGIDFSRLSAATLRHVFAFMRGEDLDPESGLPHIAHAMCCCMFLLGLAPRTELDDRVKDAA